jgi:hypothetical protein
MNIIFNPHSVLELKTTPDKDDVETPNMTPPMPQMLKQSTHDLLQRQIPVYEYYMSDVYQMNGIQTLVRALYAL